jgi:hypothetical protein
MKALIGILIVLGVIFVGWKLLDYWDAVEQQREAREKAASAQLNPTSLPGVPYDLEGPLQEAYKKGAAGLKDWLERSRHSPQIKDPRLAWVQLDYAVLISKDNPVEAKRVFADLKDRLSPQSAVYPRLKLLEKSFE